MSATWWRSSTTPQARLRPACSRPPTATAIISLTDHATGTLAARFDYDAFGNQRLRTNEIAKSGNGATALSQAVKNCRWGFSSKTEDFDTGLLYYGYRFYGPEDGRWLNRDPLGERGGVNLYGFLENNGINSIDVLGLDTYLLLWGDEQGVPFRQAAEGMKAKIESSEEFDAECDKAVVVGVKDFNDVQSALKGNSDIQKIHFFVHSGPGILYLNMMSTNADSNISVNGGTHDITDYLNWGFFMDPIEFNSRGVRELDNSNMNKFKLFEWKPRTSVHVHGCNSSFIARELGRHFTSFGYGYSGTCYLPVIDDVPTPSTGLNYYWLLKAGKAKSD